MSLITKQSSSTGTTTSTYAMANSHRTRRQTTAWPPSYYEPDTISLSRRTTTYTRINSVDDAYYEKISANRNTMSNANHALNIRQGYVFPLCSVFPQNNVLPLNGGWEMSANAQTQDAHSPFNTFALAPPAACFLRAVDDLLRIELDAKLNETNSCKHPQEPNENETKRLSNETNSNEHVVETTNVHELNIAGKAIDEILTMPTEIVGEPNR